MNNSVTLLLIEDDAIVLLALETMLYDGGYTCLSATSGESGLKLIEDHIDAAHALITDIRLGGPDGWQLARHARGLKPTIPVIYMTGDSAAGWPSEGVPNSVVLQKPFAEAQLLALVSNLINAATASQLGQG